MDKPLKTMPHFMLNRKVTTPTEYRRRNCVMVSYQLPLLKHCFILCSDQNANGGQDERYALMTFFLKEAERLAQDCVGDAQAFMLVHSGMTIRKRSGWHLHVFVIQHRWQKAWVYAVLGVKNATLAMASLVRITL